MKTLEDIHHELFTARLEISRRTLFRELKALAIIPLGRRQRPQLYPDDATARILASRGFPLPEPATLATMRTLRAERLRANGGRP